MPIVVLFPERVIEPISIKDLPANAPELELAQRLAEYGELRMRRIASLPNQKSALAKLAFVGLQQRLLSSIAAFAKTLRVHRKTLERLVAGERLYATPLVAQAFISSGIQDESLVLALEDRGAEETVGAA